MTKLLANSSILISLNLPLKAFHYIFITPIRYSSQTMITNVDLDFFAILAAVLLTLLTLLLKRWNNGQKYIVIKKFTDFL